MDDAQTRELNAAVKGQQFMDETDNAAIWNGKAAVVNKKKDLDDEIETIMDIDEGITDKSGVGKKKKAAKEKAAKTALKVGKGLASYYRDQGDLESLGEIDYAWYELRYVKDEDALDRWKLIHDKAAPLATTLDTGGYGVDAALVTRLGTESDAFRDVWGKPKDAVADTKAKNAALDREFVTLRTIITDLKDRLLQFEEDNKIFYDGVIAAFGVDDVGVRHRAIEIVYVDDETDIRLENVDAELEEVGLKKKSSKVGVVIYMHSELEDGNYTLLSKKANYENRTTKPVKSETGKLTRLVVRLVKLPGKGVIN